MIIINLLLLEKDFTVWVHLTWNGEFGWTRNEDEYWNKNPLHFQVIFSSDKISPNEILKKRMFYRIFADFYCIFVWSLVFTGKKVIIICLWVIFFCLLHNSSKEVEKWIFHVIRMERNIKDEHKNELLERLARKVYDDEINESDWIKDWKEKWNWMKK